MSDFDSDQIAKIVDEMSVDRTDAWRFTRGIVDSVNSENEANIYVEGHDNLTENVPAVITYNPRVGDKVMVLRTGIGGSDMVLFGVIPDGTYKVGHWYPLTITSTWVWYGSPFSIPFVTIDSHARVRIRGSIRDPNTASYSPPGYSYPGSVATLPAKFRPPETVIINVVAQIDGIVQQIFLEVNPSGTIVPVQPLIQEGPPIQWLSLDNINFKAA